MRKKILLVEDDDDLRDALAESLEVEGHRVEPAMNGADALARLNAGARPDVIVLDLMMPVMDGWQFRAAQLSNPEHADIPVIVITAAGGMKHIDARQIIRKPFAPEDLFRAVAAV